MMGAVEEFQRQAETKPEYWLGYLAAEVEAAIDSLASDPHHPERLAEDVRPIRLSLERALRGFRSSEAAHGVVGYLVEARDGEALSLCLTIGQAEKMRRQAAVYITAAATCGHPDGPPYPATKLPARVRPVNREQRDAVLADGTPTLDREA